MSVKKNGHLKFELVVELKKLFMKKRKQPMDTIISKQTEKKHIFRE